MVSHVLIMMNVPIVLTGKLQLAIDGLRARTEHKSVVSHPSTLVVTLMQPVRITTEGTLAPVTLAFQVKLLIFNQIVFSDKKFKNNFRKWSFMYRY